MAQLDQPLSSVVATSAPRATFKPTKLSIGSWVLYDLANTIFSMGVISLFFPLLVRDARGAERADVTYSIITAISMGIIFIVSPLLGAMTDRTRRRMPFLVVSTLICVGFTALLGRMGFYLSAIFFIIANIGFQAGLQFYDAMLPDVSTEENRGKIGGIGVAVGYLGSFIAVGIGLVLTAGGKPLDKPLAFGLVALFFLLFALPCFFFVKERGNPRPRPINWEMVRSSTRETIATLRSGNRYPGLLRFLMGRIFYTDSINTVISIMALYTVNVAVNNGLSESAGEQQANLILFSAITFAVIGGFVWGWLTDKLGPKHTLNLVLGMWVLIFLGAAAVGLFDLPLLAMYIVAAVAGFSLGGVWSADRPYMLRLTPPARIGEFYGLYGMVGRFSAITGPIIWATTSYLTINLLGMKPLKGQSIGVLVLMLMIIVSYFILRPVSDEPRIWTGDDLLPEEGRD